MTIHPLLHLVATQPHLVVDHAEAYAGVAAEEWATLLAGWKRRLLLFSIALGLAGVALVLAGVSALLWAAAPASPVRAPWALIVIPLTPALLAAICVAFGLGRTVEAFATLKRQIAADLSLLRESGNA